MATDTSRRKVIKGLAAGVAGAALFRSPNVLSSLAANSEPVDAMIIGSGFGGAVTALRLAEQGIHTVMLERGKRWRVNKNNQDTFSSLQDPDGRSAWLSETSLLGEPKPIDRYIGVLDLSIGNGIASLSGAGVGGGSLVYAGALYQPNQRMFDQFLGHEVDYHEMDNIYYPKVKSVIRPKRIPRDILRQPEYRAARNWYRMGRNAGMDPQFLDLGVSWKRVREELRGERVRSVVEGEFWYGNNSGAKRSLDKNYLRRAERSGYLDIQTQQNVTDISQHSDGRYIVTSSEIDTNGAVIARRTYVVKKLFLAAGSQATSKLLVRAKGRGDLPLLNQDVGKYWGNNGDFFGQITGVNPRIQPHVGGTVPVAIEDHFNPIAPITVECYADFRFSAEDGLIPSIGMSTPPAKGFFQYNPATDDVTLNWPSTDPDIVKTIEAGTLSYENLAEAFGLKRRNVRKVRHGHYCELPDASPVTASVTAHPLGGVVLGKATDNIGRLDNYQGLYVMDGSLIPGNTGCTNPALTIAALAERNIEKILERDF